MAQQLLWQFGDHLDDDKALRGFFDEDKHTDYQPWRACFAGLGVVPPEGVTFLVRLDQEFEESVVRSHGFTRRVNHWIKVGLHLGLKQFETVRWKIFKHEKHGFFFAFFFPTTVILQQECNHYKLYHLHLFFFRFLWEQYDLPERTRELWGKLRNKIPHFNRLAAIWLAEKAPYLEKKKTYGISESYGTYGHHLLKYRKSSVVKQICAPGGHNLWDHFMKYPKMHNFDNELFGQSYLSEDPPKELVALDWFTRGLGSRLEKQEVFLNGILLNINEALKK